MAEITDADRAKARAMLKRYGLPQVEPYMEDEIARAIAEAREEGQRQRDAEYARSFDEHGGWTSLTSCASAWHRVVETLDEVEPNWVVNSHGGCGIDRAIDAIKSLHRARPGCVIDDKGVVRRVLGTFKLTNDGAIACEEGECWAVYREGRGEPIAVGRARRSGNPTDYGCWWQIDDCDSESVEVLSTWSTESAARAAAESAKGTP